MKTKAKLVPEDGMYHVKFKNDGERCWRFATSRLLTLEEAKSFAHIIRTSGGY